MDPNSASAGAPKSGKDKEKKSKKNYDDGEGKKKFVSVWCSCCAVSRLLWWSGRVFVNTLMLEPGCLLNSKMFEFTFPTWNRKARISLRSFASCSLSASTSLEEVECELKCVLKHHCSFKWLRWSGSDLKRSIQVTLNLFLFRRL